MIGILLDTSAYSDIFRENKEVLEAIQTAEIIVINPVILGELYVGFSLGKHELLNAKNLDRFLTSPRTQIVPITNETALRYSNILIGLRKSGTPIPTNDIWIAATAMEHGLTVVTTDKHFKFIPQILCKFCEK